jgi:hypothetical protein
VPVGLLLGSFDDGLLASILVTQALTLVLLYSAFWRWPAPTGSPWPAARDRLCAALRRPSHQYFTEPLQLLAVAGFVLIMCAAPRWPAAFTLVALGAAGGLALLAKVSSPAYCLGPALVASWHAWRRRRLSPGEWRRPRTVAAALVAAVLVACAAGWYRRNLPFVLEHVRGSASGPIAEIYGERAPFVQALRFRLELHAPRSGRAWGPRSWRSWPWRSAWRPSGVDGAGHAPLNSGRSAAPPRFSWWPCCSCCR